MRLKDRVAIVTGAASGIGKAIADRFAREGALIIIADKNASAIPPAVEEIQAIGGQAQGSNVDVTDRGQIPDFVTKVVEEHQRIDILVNNAGIASALSPSQITEADWHETIRVNLTSVFLVTQRALPAMRTKRWGRIINLSSVAAQYGGIVGPHYSASKAGILGLTRSYAYFLAKEGITVNAIAPALIETDMIAGLPALTPDRLPVGSYGSVDEVARIAVLLSQSSFITGQTINPNGGVYFT